MFPPRLSTHGDRGGSCVTHLPFLLERQLRESSASAHIVRGQVSSQASRVSGPRGGPDPARFWEREPVSQGGFRCCRADPLRCGDAGQVAQSPAAPAQRPLHHRTSLPQSFGGKNLRRVGIILQRGTLILLLCCLPCWAVFINTESLLLLLRQDPEVSRSAALLVPH